MKMPSLKHFKAHTEMLFLKENQSASIIRWIREPIKIKYPTGLIGLHGTFEAEAEGYRRSIMTAQYDKYSGYSIT